MAAVRDRKDPVVVVDSSSSGSSDDSSDDDEVLSFSPNYQLAEREMNAFDKLRRSKYRPTFASSSRAVSGTNDDGKFYMIQVGNVVRKGKDLPSGKNLADYIDSNGRFNCLKFILDHAKEFPTISIRIQCEESRKTAEVGCERFFNLSGYVSAEKRTKLGVRTYERIAMLAAILPKIYIDRALVAQEYLKRCKEGAWKKELDEEALKCWNLERIIEAELAGTQPPPATTMDEFLGE
jgi:hypothetical protein